MTRAELVQRMRDTSAVMAFTAEEMAFYGKSDEAVQHAQELAGAAEIVSSWADELEKEETK